MLSVVSVVAQTGTLVGQILAQIPELRHLVSVSTSEAVVALCRASKPKIVVMELESPDSQGFDIINGLAVSRVASPILAIADEFSEAILYRLRFCNIAGAVTLSPSAATEVRKAVFALASGKYYFDQEVLQQTRKMHMPPDAFHKVLSLREIELLPLFGYGLKDREVAESVGATSRAIKAVRHRTMSKLGLHRRDDLMRWAARKGFCDLTKTTRPKPFRY